MLEGNQTNQKDDLDLELEEINKKNDGFVDQDDDFKNEEEIKKEEEEEKLKEEEEKKRIEAEEAEKKKKEDEEEESDDDEEKDEEDDEDEENKKNRQERPERYIPIPKYKEEKTKRQEAETKLEEAKKKITDLEKISKSKPGSKVENEKFKSFSKKYDIDEKALPELVEMIREEVFTPEIQEKLSLAEKNANELTDQGHFNTEWEGCLSDLKKEFPDANKKQLDQARKLMDQLAHTKKYHQADLDYVFFKNKSEFSDILSEIQGKKGVESGRIGKGKPGQVSGKDIKKDKSGKYDFSSLDSLSGDEKDKVLSEMNPEAYMDYIDHIESDEFGVEINRNGRKITLK